VITTYHPVKGHDIGEWEISGQIAEVPIAKVHAVGMPLPFMFGPGGGNIG
jgi:hypothetical protein